MAKSKKETAKKKGPEIEVNVSEVIDYMKIKGDFAPALRAVVERKIAVDAAKKAGAQVTKSELQTTADAFRVVQGLHKASDMNDWLAASGLSLDAFEQYLEANILISKLKDKLAASAKAKYHNAPEIRATIRDMAYSEWLVKAV